MDEIWKDIEGWENLYQVSNLGNVRSLDRYVVNGRYGNIYLKKGKMMSLIINSYGYLYVGLYKDGKQTMYFVHRLVAQAFIPNPDNLPQCNHKDENPLNNRVDNLEWCDAKYNVNYGKGNERRKNSNRNNPKQSKKVYQYTLDNQLVKVWASSNECGRNGFCQSHVASCCRGEHRKHKGYKWSYEPL